MEVTILLLWHFLKHFKKHTYESEAYLGQFFAFTLSQILKIFFLPIRKYLGQFLLLIFFFEIFKKSYLRIWKIPGTTFCLEHFQIFKIANLQIWNISGKIFLLIPFFKYLKKHTYKSQKYQRQFFWLYPFSNI